MFEKLNPFNTTLYIAVHINGSIDEATKNLYQYNMGSKDKDAAYIKALEFNYNINYKDKTYKINREDIKLQNKPVYLFKVLGYNIEKYKYDKNNNTYYFYNKISDIKCIEQSLPDIIFKRLGYTKMIKHPGIEIVRTRLYKTCIKNAQNLLKPYPLHIKKGIYQINHEYLHESEYKDFIEGITNEISIFKYDIWNSFPAARADEPRNEFYKYLKKFTAALSKVCPSNVDISFEGGDWDTGEIYIIIK